MKALKILKSLTPDARILTDTDHAIWDLVDRDLLVEQLLEEPWEDVMQAIYLLWEQRGLTFRWAFEILEQLPGRTSFESNGRLFPLKINHIYKTRKGRAVKVICTEGDMFGYVDSQGSTMSVNKNGMMDKVFPSSVDLVEHIGPADDMEEPEQSDTPIELEFGKMYITRGGDCVGPLFQTDFDDYPFGYGMITWTSDGRNNRLCQSSNDIVAEYEEQIVESEEGVKHDSDKPELGFLLKSFPNGLTAAAKQNSFGARKYSPMNWVKVDDERYENALSRHLVQSLTKPNETDESGEYHLAAVIWNALALYEKRYGDLNESIDNNQ